MESPSQAAMRLAQTIVGAVNLIGLFAAPRGLYAVSQKGAVPTREQLLEQVAALAGAAEDMSTRDVLQRFRAACASWTPGPVAPPEMIQVAREVLIAFDVNEPAVGWDAFDPTADT